MVTNQMAKFRPHVFISTFNLFSGIPDFFEA